MLGFLCKTIGGKRCADRGCHRRSGGGRNGLPLMLIGQTIQQLPAAGRLPGPLRVRSFIERSLSSSLLWTGKTMGDTGGGATVRPARTNPTKPGLF